MTVISTEQNYNQTRNKSDEGDVKHEVDVLPVKQNGQVGSLRAPLRMSGAIRSANRRTFRFYKLKFSNEFQTLWVMGKWYKTIGMSKFALSVQWSASNNPGTALSLCKFEERKVHLQSPQQKKSRMRIRGQHFQLSYSPLLHLSIIYVKRK